MFKTVEHPTDFHSGSAESYLTQVFNSSTSGIPWQTTSLGSCSQLCTGILAAGRAEEAGTSQPMLAASQTALGFLQLGGTKQAHWKKKKPQAHELRFSASSGNSLKLQCLESEGSSWAVWIMTPCWEFLSKSLRNERISLEKSKESCLENFQCKYFFHLKMLSNWA